MRLAVWALAFVCGVLPGVAWGAWAFGAACLLGGTAFMLLARRRWWTLAVAAAGLVLGAGHGYQQQVVAVHREKELRAMMAGGRLCAVGQVVQGDDPNDTHSGAAKRFRILGTLEEGGGATADRSVHLSVSLIPEDDLPADTVRVGDQVRVCGEWQPPFGFFNPGAGAGWPQVALKADAGSLRVTRVQRRRSGPWWWPWRIATRMRDALSAAYGSIQPQRAAFLRATVLGERAAVSPDIELGFKAAGATHALSVSGLHLAAVAALFFIGLRGLLLLWPWAAVALPVVPMAAVLCIPTVLFYTLVTGEAVATWRSALMACCLFGGFALRRPSAIAASIAVAAVLTVLTSAYWLWDVSFQLSVVSVVALALFATRLGPQPATRAGFAAFAGHWLCKGLAATAAAGLLTAPLVAYHFGEVTPAAPLGNLTLTPLVELLVVPLGLLGASVAALVPVAAPISLWPAGMSAAITMRVALWFSRLAPVWHLSPPSVLGTLAITAGVACALRGASRTCTSRGRWLFCAVLLWSVAAGLWGWRRWRTHHRDGVRVTFLDVGQGDASVLEGPNGFVAVIDGGGLGTNFDTGARLVVPFLRREGLDHIDLVVLSHPHPDHALGLFAVLRDFTVRTLWMPVSAQGPEHDGAFIRNLRTLAQTAGTAVSEPKAFRTGSLLIQPMGPWDEQRIAAPEGLSVNDASLSVRFSLGARSVFFAGDLEAPGELELAERAQQGLLDPRSDILKVPHHGSKTSSSAELLDVVKPSLAVISAGRGNRFGFPHREVLERYNDANVAVLRTDTDGAVQLQWTQGSDAGTRIAVHCAWSTQGLCANF